MSHSSNELTTYTGAKYDAGVQDILSIGTEQIQPTRPLIVRSCPIAS
jgi:hypothetical protein